VTYATSTPLICSVSGTTVTALAVGTCTVSATKAASGFYNAITSGGVNMSVSKVNQATLNVSATPTSISGGLQTSTLSSIGGSGDGAVTYATSTPLICSVSGTTVTPLAVGECEIKATKASSALYNAIDSSEVEIRVSRGSQASFSISVSPIGISYGQTATLSSTGGSGAGTVTYATSTTNICSVSGTTVTTLAVGTCVVTGTKAASGLYDAITSSSVNITISKADQAAFSISSSANSISGGQTSTLSSSGGSGDGAVTYATSTPLICSVSGTTVTPLAVGTCTVSATKATSALYNAITSSGTNITITGSAQATFSITASPTSINAGITSALSSSGGSGLGAVTYATSTPLICSVSGTTVTPIAEGTCTVSGTKASSALYNAITSSAISITVSKINQAAFSISATSSSVGFDGQQTSTISASGGSGSGAVSYATSTPLICSITSGGLVNALALGTCSVTATKASSALYNAITSSGINIKIKAVSRFVSVLFSATNVTNGPVDIVSAYNKCKDLGLTLGTDAEFIAAGGTSTEPRLFYPGLLAGSGRSSPVYNTRCMASTTSYFCSASPSFYFEAYGATAAGYGYTAKSLSTGTLYEYIGAAPPSSGGGALVQSRSIPNSARYYCKVSDDD
jgi:hypothetical protein